MTDDETTASRPTLRWHLRSLLDAARAHGSVGTSADVALAVDAAMWYAEQSGQALPEILGAAADRDFRLPIEIAEIQRGWLGAAAEVERRQYLPTLAREFALSVQTGEYLSSPSITDVAVTAALARTVKGTGPLTFLDLAVGTGTTLLSIAQAANDLGYSPRALAQDLNFEVAVFAAAVMFLGGVESQVHRGDSLLVDPFADTSVDVAVSQPPFGLNWTRQESEVRDRHSSAGWYPWGLPQRSDSTWLFASRLIEKLRCPEEGGGRAVTFMAPGALQRHGAENEIRRAILEQDLVEAIIGLPGRLSPLTDILLYAVVFANKKPENRKGKIRVINLRPYFETSRDRRTTPRALTAEAFDVLSDGLRSLNPRVACRTVPVEYFIRRRVQVRREGHAQLVSDAQLPEWDVYLPGTQGVESSIIQRYGPIGVASSSADTLFCPLEIDSLFDETLRRVSQWSKQQQWPTTRLSALVASAPYVFGEAGGIPDQSSVLLPTFVRGDASAGNTAATTEGGRVLQLHLFANVISTNFLAGWLNSALGRDCRRRAQDVGSSGAVIRAVRTDQRSLMRYLDELVVPVPPMVVQEGIAAADGRLAAVSNIVEGSRQRLWNAPLHASQVVRRFDPLFDKSPAAWAGDLPFPIASALWTLESKRVNVDAAHKQMFLVWEAYAAFTGTVLLSALSQDPVLRETEVPRLREALVSAHLSMEHATLGSWSVVVQRLSSCFRGLLQSEDADERARVLQIFGSPSVDTLARLLSTSAVQLLSDANAKRNLWDGHTGSVGEPEQQRHLEYLDSRLEELRDVIGPTWLELRCVRAGDGFKRHGDVVQKVELAVGPNTPFRQAEIRVGELMEKGELYLTTEGAAQPLPLEHLLILRSSPDGARYTCYFYNRTDKSGVRLISYQSADQSDLTGQFDDVLAAVQDLLTPAAQFGHSEAYQVDGIPSQ
jgi:type I restriction enzyme M protein